MHIDEPRETGWRRRKKWMILRGAVEDRVAGDVSVDDLTCQPPSSDHHWNMGCVSPFYFISN